MVILPTKRPIQGPADGQPPAKRVWVGDGTSWLAVNHNHDHPQKDDTWLLSTTEFAPPVQPPAQQPEVTPDEEPQIITLQRIPPPDNPRRKCIMLARARENNKWFQAIPHGIDIFMQRSNMKVLARFACALEKEAADMVDSGYNPTKLERLKITTKHIMQRSQEINAWITNLWEELHELDCKVAANAAAADAAAAADGGAATAANPFNSPNPEKPENEVHQVAMLGSGLRLIKEQTEQSFDLLEQILQDNEGGVLPAVQYCKFLEALFIEKMCAKPGEGL